MTEHTNNQCLSLISIAVPCRRKKNCQTKRHTRIPINKPSHTHKSNDLNVCIHLSTNYVLNSDKHWCCGIFIFFLYLYLFLNECQPLLQSRLFL